MKFYMLRCPECQMTLPFAEREQRDVWASEHSQTGHTVVHTWEEIR